VLFARIDPADPATVEFALNYTLLGFSSTDLESLGYFEVEAMKGGPGDNQNYLWNDEYSKSEAGSPYPAVVSDLTKSEFDTQGLENIYEVDTLVLQTNFLVDPFLAVKGTYSGLFAEPSEVAQESSGFFRMTVTPKGRFSASLQIGGTRYPMSGRLARNGSTQKTIARPRASKLAVGLQLAMHNGSDQIAGTVSDGTWTAELAGDRAVFNSRTKPAPQAGRYTMVLPGTGGSTAEPGGESYATLTVDTAGRIRLVSSLADGTKVSQAASVSKHGHWPFYVPLYRGQGSVSSWLSFADMAQQDLGGEVAWIKPATPAAKYYPSGFTNQTSASGSRYSPPTGGNRVLNLTAAELLLQSDNLAQGIISPVMVTAGNRAINLSTNRLSLVFSLGTGSFRGSVADPASSKSISFSGVVLQKENAGRGFFLGGDESRRILFR
jgi:hypothetical protein